MWGRITVTVFDIKKEVHVHLTREEECTLPKTPVGFGRGKGCGEH